MAGPRTFNGEPIPEEMTKNAFKRLKRKERREADRDEYIEKRREKRREARLRHPKRRKKAVKGSQQKHSGVSIVLDCGFDDLMTTHERTSLSTQLTRCYSDNKRSLRPVNLIISGFNGQLKSRFENEMNATHKYWNSNIAFEEGEHIVEDKSKAVYLTGDSEEVLSELEPGCTYYVGGIVDKNRYKDLCLNKARDLGIRAARLPIDEHIKVSGRRVLTTNQAFELLIRWLELRDWKRAFEATIPARKLVEKEEGEVSEGNESDAAGDGAGDAAGDGDGDAAGDAAGDNDQNNDQDNGAHDEGEKTASKR